ncbi:MAG: arginine--tRNA ligase [Patescibacteria group bacterium]
MFRKLIADEIAKVVPGGTGFSVEVPETAEHGDYASNAALVLAKKEGKNPLEMAEKLALRLRSGQLSRFCDKVEIAGPGFLNFFIASSILTSSLWGKSVKNNSHELFPNKSFFKRLFLKKKIVIVEYFQLNIAKRPHVGHMRSAIIGDALKRMFIEAGYKAISDTHVGDWGTQFGILLLEYKDLEPHMRHEIFSQGDPFEKLENMYISGNENIKREASRLELAKREFAKLELGDIENRKLWKEMVDISMKNLEKSAKLLNLLPFDEHRGESSYEKDMPLIVQEALQKGVAQKKDDGAVVVDLSDEGLGEAVLIKSDGASTYLLRDLATIRYRKEKYDFYKNIYVVDMRQGYHFGQVFEVAKKLGYAKEEEIYEDVLHISYGIVKLPEGTMSTRAGNVISIEAMVSEAQNRAYKVIEEKNSKLKNKNEIARMVGLGAIKYFDLSHNRKTNIEFDWDRALSFEGNTGPYLQYTYARLRSILRKHGKSKIKEIFRDDIDSEERQILLSISRFDEELERALINYYPHVLADYLYVLAQKTNEFYHSHPILQENDQEKKQFRLALISKISETLKKGLYLLGIDAPEEM